MLKPALAVVFFLLLISSVSGFCAADLPVLRIGVLKFGTVNWELDVIKHHQLDRKAGYQLEIVPLASKNATHVAIQGGAADIVVTDWLWVSRQRSENKNYAFVPYSTTVGSLMARPDSDINALADLAGKKLGIAGGSVDKSWLLLRAYGKKTLGKDLADLVEPKYGAPPLLNQLAFRNEIPAVLNFWHYTARLRAADFKAIVSVSELLQAMEIQGPMPLIGWVFHEDWGRDNTTALHAFINSSLEAKKILETSDEEWLRLEPKMKVKSATTHLALRDAWRAGIADCFDKTMRDNAAKLFDLLAQEGGTKLVGQQQALAEGTFWTEFKFNSCQR